MRVVGGHARGRKLYSPKNGTIRITADRVKESLFDILFPVDGTLFLDLFAGTGGIGIEAMSRGAKNVVFIEKTLSHIETIKKNLNLCGFKTGHETIAGTVEKGIYLLFTRGERFDIIFADPPYNKKLIGKTLCSIGEFPLLSEKGIVVMEHSLKEECKGSGKFVLTDQRKYGDTLISFLKLNG